MATPVIQSMGCTCANSVLSRSGYHLNNLGNAPRPPILGEQIPPKVGGLGGHVVLHTPKY